MESKKRKLLDTDLEAIAPHLTVSGLGDDVVVRVEVENEVTALREALVSQQQTIQELQLEVDEERNAASTATSEAMSMILKLQREKAEVQMEFRQFKRFAEEKMAHDMQELNELDELVLEKEQLIQSLSFEVESCRKKLKSFGINDLDDCEYPNLRCKVPFRNDGNIEDDSESLTLDKYTPTTSMNQYHTLQGKIYEMEVEKEEINDFDGEYSHGSCRNDDNDNYDDNNDCCNDGDVDNCDDNESTSARVYTIDAVHAAVPNEGTRDQHDAIDGSDIRKLYMRLQALEADRESMRHAILSMRTEKAQVELMKEIARQLCKEGAPPKNNTKIVKRTSFIFSFMSLIKWVLSIFWRKRDTKPRYTCGATASNIGLLLLLDKSPRLNQWQCLLRSSKL